MAMARLLELAKRSVEESARVLVKVMLLGAELGKLWG